MQNMERKTKGCPTDSQRKMQEKVEQRGRETQQQVTGQSMQLHVRQSS